MTTETLKYVEACANEREHASIQKLSTADVRRLLLERKELLEALENMLEDMEESHAEEIKDDHGGDDASTCIYCRNIKAAHAAIARATGH